MAEAESPDRMTVDEAVAVALEHNRVRRHRETEQLATISRVTSRALVLDALWMAVWQSFFGRIDT